MKYNPDQTRIQLLLAREDYRTTEQALDIAIQKHCLAMTDLRLGDRIRTPGSMGAVYEITKLCMDSEEGEIVFFEGHRITPNGRLWPTPTRILDSRDRLEKVKKT